MINIPKLKGGRKVTVKIVREIVLAEFDWWGGAREKAKYLRPEDYDTLAVIISNLYPRGIDETELNNLLWHGDDAIAVWLGYKTFEALIADRAEGVKQIEAGQADSVA